VGEEVVWRYKAQGEMWCRNKLFIRSGTDLILLLTLFFLMFFFFLLLTMVLTLLEVFILSHYGPPSTGRIQELAYNTNHNHKQGATKLLN